jgi:glycosyltransferase involved in cell wall biosynthesis
MSMKIAVVVPASSEALFDNKSTQVFGGANVQMYQIARELGQCEGVDCLTLTEDYERIDFADTARFRLVKTYRKSDTVLIKFWKYHKALRTIKPDAIVQHGLTLFSSLLACYCWFFRIRFVYMFAHDNEVSGRYQESGRKNPLFWLLLRCARVLVAQSRYQRDELLRRYGKQAHILRNGFYLKPTRQSAGKYILWVARHSDWKRPELFIRLAELNPDVSFRMVCPRSKADGYDILLARARKVANLEFIEYVPFDRIDDYFAAAKVFVNTSDHEGFPQTFIQAAMNGVPVVSLNVDPDNILTDNSSGFCCHGSMETLNEKLGVLMANAALYREMSENAFRYAQESHDIRKNVRALLGLISAGGGEKHGLPA